ncbi:hypothetical protein P43SY_005713 [Pythium insidiosum]|uniref:Uncharacterized protein n=1 Tax=Pythium insidiosum TaxID=114742 RepID=A0AAD5MBL8_PYTIN|nr:hypothetical protein P43SY_005713 [Pythium insidiosum]
MAWEPPQYDGDSRLHDLWRLNEYRDDDVLSWRSLDTTRGLEVAPYSERADAIPREALVDHGGSALARRGVGGSSAVGELLRHQSHPMDIPTDIRSIDTALSAPFATEKQTLLQDALQKRDLEQKLLRLHVDKEQVEAKLAKVEQSGLKTMSARTEKAWLESRLRDLAQEISRLKMSLR